MANRAPAAAAAPTVADAADETHPAELRAIKAMKAEGLEPREIADVLKVSLATYYRRARPLRRLVAINRSFELAS